MNHTPTIAVVDDDDGVRISLSSLLRSLGYEVRAYGSGPDFLNDRGAGDPDCMITDVQMAPMTGDQLQAELIAAGRRFPLIFMTAFPTEAARLRLLALGACAYLDKPVDGEAMARCVADALRHGRDATN
ncbi:response regulator transcription factor [Achromobacter sp. NFACC18-2]|uniref:response regulator transcription factor n=1 Tax=Achromobacter sp. NFACC18-2 TaxID=1564112 RepID=UPI0008ACB5AE|nr:response regulator [Achromobacter sp. NFACC18-2]SEJ02042.1 Response regulator receiver domain-containing protein [Achromobacter sp. NFACC18-2]